MNSNNSNISPRRSKYVIRLSVPNTDRVVHTRGVTCTNIYCAHFYLLHFSFLGKYYHNPLFNTYFIYTARVFTATIDQFTRGRQITGRAPIWLPISCNSIVPSLSLSNNTHCMEYVRGMRHVHWTQCNFLWRILLLGLKQNTPTGYGPWGIQQKSDKNWWLTGIILGHNVMSSPIDWAHIQNDPWIYENVWD